MHELQEVELAQTEQDIGQVVHCMTLTLGYVPVGQLVTHWPRLMLLV